MKTWTIILLLNLPTASAWAVNKCVEDHGRIFYQDAPCPAHTRGGEMLQNVNRTFSGQAPRPLWNDGIPSHRDSGGGADTERTPSPGKPSRTIQP